MKYPKIRLVSAFPLELSEGQFICLQDPQQYLQNPILVSPEMFAIIQFFDGKHSFIDIQEAYRRRYGILLYTEQIQQVVDQLDQHFLLESPKFSAYLEQLRREFAKMPVRPSSHKGAAYPEDREALRLQLDKYFRDAKGPGELLVHQMSPFDHNKTSSLKALMAPHIDLKAGGPTFAWSYYALRASDAELFIILGTSHVDMKNFFAVTKKTFETPFGYVETDQIFVEKLAEELSYDPLEDEFIHKSEHSIEFQLVFLQYLREKMCREQTPLRIIPILCGGSMLEAIVFNRPIEQVPQLEESIRALERVVSEYDKTCIIASVDFSHVGLRYGDPTALNPGKLAMVEQTDRNLLAAMEQVNHKEFIAKLQHNRNETNVCGVVPIYTMLRLLEGTQGSLLHYDRAEVGTDSFVSFASMVWKAEV